MTDFVKQSVQQLTAAGCDSPQRDAALLWEHAGGNAEVFQQFVARRRAREPMSQILGFRAFWQHEFAVNRHVLTPRPDSEVLIEEALNALPDQQKPYRILDLGTGSGCLLLSLLHEYPAATGLGIDASPQALEVAKTNAERLNLEKRACFQQGNWAEGLTGGFDLVISNPPYIPQHERSSLMPEVRDYEPEMALFGGEDGLGFYREIVAQVPAILVHQGWLIFEVGINQAQEVATIAQQSGFDLWKIRRDYGGVERAVILRKR